MPASPESAPHQSVLAIAKGLMPLALGQLFILWQVASAQINVFEVMLMASAEIFLTTMAAAIFFSPNFTIFWRRFNDQTNVLGLASLVLFVYLALAAQELPQQEGDTTDLPDRMVAIARAALTGAVLARGLIYIGISVGLGVLVAFASNDDRRKWYANQLAPAAMTYLSLFIALSFGTYALLRIGMDHQAGVIGGNSMLGLMAIAVFCGSRVLFSGLLMEAMTRSQFEHLYADFGAGKDAEIKPPS